jgi:hypothetical protein
MQRFGRPNRSRGLIGSHDHQSKRGSQLSRPYFGQRSVVERSIRGVKLQSERRQRQFELVAFFNLAGRPVIPSHSLALRRDIVRIVRAFHDGQESIHFQDYRVSLAFCGTGENVRRDFGFHRRSTLRLGKRHRGVVEDRLHQFD